MIDQNTSKLLQQLFDLDNEIQLKHAKNLQQSFQSNSTMDKESHHEQCACLKLYSQINQQATNLNIQINSFTILNEPRLTVFFNSMVYQKQQQLNKQLYDYDQILSKYIILRKQILSCPLKINHQDILDSLKIRLKQFGQSLKQNNNKLINLCLSFQIRTMQLSHKMVDLIKVIFTQQMRNKKYKYKYHIKQTSISFLIRNQISQKADMNNIKYKYEEFMEYLEINNPELEQFKSQLKESFRELTEVYQQWKQNIGQMIKYIQNIQGESKWL